MNRVTIFLTNPAASDFEDYANGESLYRFERIGPEGPDHTVSGPVPIFIDWVLPELSGLEMCRRLRADPALRDAHITLVLDFDDLDDRRRAIRAGADDYLIGPLERRTVLDRVMALRPNRPCANRHVVGVSSLVVDLTAEQAQWNGTPLQIRPNELRLLCFFTENPNRVFSRQELIEALGKDKSPVDERTVDVWVKRLRMGLKQAGARHLLRTVRTRGYVLDAPRAMH
ncbi:response regulator transcription factor [Altericroceibacterium xinjiangense]|uniref:response regulator transcription factor n=1 Tax=Altericroceibacterium xinjiangense TaxID=762261 RepID=UPI000F7F9AD1|nr:response regulator transcription factor [Altericroceibacterium xinjiangense]